MDAKRRSPLWVFAGGCLTGAAFIGLRTGGSESTPAISAASSVERRLVADSAIQQSPVEPPPATEPARDPAKVTAAPQADPADPGTTEAGNSVADVLARLEAEYRQRNAPARAEALPSPPSGAPTAVSEAAAPKLPAREQPTVVRAAPPPPEASPSDARAANVPVEPKPIPYAAKEEPVRVASVGDAQESAAQVAAQQVTVEAQQLAALQQAALVQQQYAYLRYQYMGFLPLAATPQVAHPAQIPASIPASTQRRTPNDRVVPGFPPSISATDNPWGFHYAPSYLVR